MAKPNCGRFLEQRKGEMMSYLASVFSFLVTNLYFSIFFLCLLGVQVVIFYYVINRVDFLRIFGHSEPVSRRCCLQRLQLARWFKFLILAMALLIFALLLHDLHSGILRRVPTPLALAGFVVVTSFVLVVLAIGFSAKTPVNGFHIERFKIYIHKCGDRLIADIHDRMVNLNNKDIHSECADCVARLLDMNFDEITMKSHLLGRYRNTEKQKIMTRWLMKKITNVNVQINLGPLEKTGILEWLAIYWVTKFSGKGAPCKMKRRLTIIRCS